MYVKEVHGRVYFQRIEKACNWITLVSSFNSQSIVFVYREKVYTICQYIDCLSPLLGDQIGLFKLRLGAVLLISVGPPEIKAIRCVLLAFCITVDIFVNMRRKAFCVRIGGYIYCSQLLAPVVNKQRYIYRLVLSHRGFSSFSIALHIYVYTL